MLDFKRVNDAAICHLDSLLQEILPGGQLIGREYCCGDLTGRSGQSMKVNVSTGEWADFADTAKGGDPVSLVAAVRQCNQGTAAQWLADRLGVDPGTSYHSTIKPPPAKKSQESSVHAEEEAISFPWKMAKRDDEAINSYLRRRSITLDQIPLALKWGSYRDKTGQQVNQLVCAASKPTDTKVYAVQRLFIDTNSWTKTDAKMLGSVSGRGVWFDRKGDHTTVAVGEGVETSLSFMAATNGIFSTVAALSAGNMPTLELPEETQYLYVLVDSDPAKKGMAGQHAAYALAQKFEASRPDRKVYIITPDDTCFTDNPAKMDFNDLLQADPSGDSVGARLESAIPFEKMQWQPNANDRDSRQPDGGKAKIDPKLALEKFVVKREYTDKLGQEEFLIDNLLIKQHILVVVAMSGGGKTTYFFWHVAKLLAKKGNTVLYLDNDSATSDHASMREFAERYGFSFLNPDANVGTSVDELKMTLLEIANADSDLSGWVVIIDTLKKFSNLMAKEAVKEFFKLCRRLTTRGATVVLLAHANKYRNAEGHLIPEGVGDIRSDTDDLIIFERGKNADGGIDVTTVVDPDRNAKVRGIFRPFSFHISPDREITFYPQPLSLVDPTQTAAPKATDDEILTAAAEFLGGMCEPIMQQVLVNRVCDLTGAGQKRVRQLITQHSERADLPAKVGLKFWFTVGPNNRLLYRLPVVERLPEQTAMFDENQFGKHELGFGDRF